jgi:DNA-binding transcriptional MocR family regulator
MKAKSHVSRRRMKAEPTWIARLRAEIARGPKAAAIAEGLSRAVEIGELALGERLPPQRTLADALGVDLTTVTRAYAQARTMGLLAGETGRGTFVRGAASPSGLVIDLSMNLPPPPGGESLRDLLQAGFADLLRHGEPAALMTYRSGFGARRDRRAAQVWLAPRLGDIAEERIFIAPGAQSTLAALLTMLARAGDVVLAEPQTYPGFLAAARLLGVRLAAMECDSGGPVITALETQCRKLKPKALYITPTLQNPTTRTMSETRRRALAALARKLDLPLIEDDAYGAFAAHLSPLARLAPDHVFHVSTLSKCLSPGLRTAFVVAPLAASNRVAEALRAICLMPVPFLSDMATRWIETGIAARLFDAIEKESAARMELARAILPARAQGGPEGFHLWMTAPKGWWRGPYVAAARARGVVTVGGDLFAADSAPAPAVRISLGAAPDRERLAAGLQALAALEREEDLRAIV